MTEDRETTLEYILFLFVRKFLLIMIRQGKYGLDFKNTFAKMIMDILLLMFFRTNTAITNQQIKAMGEALSSSGHLKAVVDLSALLICDFPCT